MQTEEIRKYQDRIHQAPGDLAAYEALERIYTRGQDFAALVELYRRKALHVVEVGEKRSLWRNVARVAEEVLDEPVLAIEMAREALPAEALDRATLKALEGLCRRHKRFDDLSHFLSLVAKSAEDRVDALGAMFRLGELYRRELDDPAAALDTFIALVQQQPRHPEGLAALGDLLGDATLRRDAASALEAAYRATSDWDRLFQLHDRLLATGALDEAERGVLLQRRATLVEERRGPQAAFPEFAKAFVEAGRSEAVRESLERIAARAGLWRDLLQVYLRSLEGTRGDESSNRILRRAAEIAEENLGLKAVAEKCWRQLLDFEHGSEEALSALERLYVESGDDAKLLGILELRIERAEASADSTTESQVALQELLARAGDIAEHRLSRFPVAIAKYEALLVADPSSSDAKSALLRLYPRAARWKELVAHLLHHAADADRNDVRRRVAEIYEDKLRDVPKAIEQLEELRRALPGDAKALEALTRLYEKAQKHEALQGVLDERVAGATTAEERAVLRLKIAGVLRTGLHRALEAADLYGEILADGKGAQDDAARAALEGMLTRPTTRARAAAILERHYTGALAWQRLVDFYERVLPELDGTAARARVLETSAWIYEHELESPERAFWSYGRALKEHPASPFAEREILRIATELSFQDQLAGLLEDALDTLSGATFVPPRPAEPAVPTLKPFAFDEEKTNVVSEAEILDAAVLLDEVELEVEPLFEDATAGSEGAEVIVDEELLEEAEQTSAEDEGDGEPIVLELSKLPSEARSGPDSPEPKEATALRFSFRLATLNEEVLERFETAASWYRRVREIDAGHLDALVALDRLALARQDHAELRDVLRARVERTKRSEDEIALRLRLGALLDEQFSDADGAISEYRAALAADPSSQTAFDALEAVLRRTGRWEVLADLYRTTLDRPSPSPRAIALKLAQLLDRELSDPEAALAVLRPLLATDPHDEDALMAFERSALAAGYDRDERALELLKVIEALRDLAAQGAQWRERERRIGALLEGPLGRPGAAVERYARVLSEDATDAEAREALERLVRQPNTLDAGAAVLEPFYRQRSDWDALIQLFELKLEASPEGAPRAKVYAEIARIAEENADNVEAALSAYTLALKAEPTSAAYLDAVDRLASELGRFEELCEILDDNAVARELADADAADRVVVLRRLAEVSATALEDRERALKAYREALALAPDDAGLFRALEEIYAHLERWRDLADLFRSALERDPDNRAYALRLADLLEVILESPEEALEVLRGMLDRRAHDADALRAFEGVFTRAGLDKTKRADQIIPVLEALRAEAGDASAKRAYEFRVAEILEHSLSRPLDSVARYGNVLADDRKHKGALGALERLSLRTDCRVSACALLETHYRKTDEPGPLADVLERRLEDVVPRDERAHVLAEIGALREERQGDEAVAFHAYSRAFEEDPSAPKFLAAVERLGTKLARSSEVAELLERGDEALARARGRDTTAAASHRVGLLVFLANLYRSTLDEPARAISAFERAHALAPEKDDVFVALDSLYTSEERFEDLATLYRGQLDRDGSDKTTGLKLARLFDEVLGRADDALDVLRALLARDARDVALLRAFDGIFVGAGLDAREGARELLPVLLALRDAHEGAAAREYEFRAGELRELSLREPADAIPNYAAVLRADPGHAGARRALERLLEVQATRAPAATVLDPYYRAQEEWRPLVLLLELRAGDAAEPRERAAILAEVGQIAEERCGDRETAFGAYARAFGARPESQVLFDAACRLAQDDGRFEELADLLTTAAAALDAQPKRAPSAYRVAVLQKLAVTAATLLGDNERAIEAYTRALDLDADSDATLTGLDRLYTAENRTRELAETIEREIARAEKVKGTYDKLELHRRLARLREEVFGDLEGAAKAFEALRGIKPADAEATTGLERLYEATGRNRELAELLLGTTQAEGEDDAAATGVRPLARQRLLRAAVLLEESVGDLVRARGVYARLRAFDENDLEALEGLVRVLSGPEMSGREGELLEVHEALLSKAGDETSRADLLHKQGVLLAGPLGKPERAVERFTRVLDAVPGHREALLALESLAQRADVRDVAVPKLERHYERVGAWQALVDLYESLLATRDAGGRRALLEKMAKIYETELGNPRLAFREYARLFREAPEVRDTLEVLERLAQEMGSFERLANLYDELVRETPATTQDNALGLHLTLRLARLYEETLGRRTLAVDRYRFALELDPSCREALDALDRIYSSTEDWPHLMKILERKLELAATDTDKVALHCRIGSLFEREFGFAGAAVDSFEAALALAPGDETSIAALERIFAQRDDLVLRQHISDTLRPLYTERGEQRRQAALDLGIAEVLPADDREPFLLDAARVHESLGEADRAFRILVQGLHDGCHTQLLMTHLERLAHTTGAWSELCNATDAASESLKEDDPRREELTLLAAKWYWDRLSNPAAAEQRYTWVFLRDPAASPAFRALEAIYTAVLAENPDKVLDLYRRRLAVVRAKDERAQLLKRSANLCADFLMKDEDAILAYEEALRMTPDDGEVLEALVPLYEKTKRFNDLCRVLARQLDRARTDDDKFVLMRRLAEVHGAELNDDGEAIRNYRGALEIVSGDLELWRALRWHCARAHRWAELADALRSELRLSEDPVDRVGVARELAQIEEERLGHAREAADAFSIVMELEPDDDGAAAKYEQLLEQVERWNELALFYDKRLGGTLQTGERVRILGALASIAEVHLGDAARAAAALAQRCELKPDDLAALRELARIYDQQGRWKECFEFLKAQVKRLGEIGDVAVELLCRMGQLCEERANNIEVAEKCYKRALSIDGRSRLSLDGLKRVYVHRKEPGLVAQVLQAQEALSQGEERAALATERGAILRDEVGDLAGAAAAFESALQASALHADAAVGLIGLAERGVAPEKIRSHMMMLIEVFAKTRRIRDRHLLLHKLGAFAENGGDGPRAIAAYEAAYQAASTHLPTLLSLARLYYDAGHWEKALKMLQILLLNEGSLPTAADRVELFYRLGAIRQKMSERARAINMFQRALEIDAGHAPSRKALQDLIGA